MESGKIKVVRVDLIQYDWCPDKEGELWTQTHGEKAM